MSSLRIVSTGSYVPEKVLTNFDLEKIVETTDEWITTRTGIKERRIADADKASSDLAAPALRIALERAGITVNQLDALIVATGTPDRLFPSTAVRTLKLLGASKPIPAFDILAACSGFNYALEVARGLARIDGYTYIAVVGAEVLSKFINWNDRSTCVLFGDGAGALIFKKVADDGFLYGRLYSDGSLDELLEIPGGGSRIPPGKAPEDLYTIKMQGREVFKHAVVKLSEAVLEALNASGLAVEMIDGVFAHQANKRIIDAVCERTGIDPAKVRMNIDRLGNTSAASIPILIDEAFQEGSIRKGAHYLIFSFGAGFVWGVHIYKHT
jgi:3-oxoacyl-[acyl-carrier-protein] synthase-3